MVSKSKLIKNRIMKIAFDIDFYGLAYTNPKNKTGIYRVIENTLLGLLDKQVDIRLYAKTHLLDAIAYLNEHPSLSNQKPPIQINVNDPFWFSLDNHTRQLKKEFSRDTDSLSIIQQALFKGISFSRRFIPKVEENRKKTLETILQQAEIYHSPFLGISSEVRSQKKLKCFLTVYDLIPILLPQYVQSTGFSWTDIAIRSLIPDDFVFAISQATKNDLCNYKRDLVPDHVYVTHLAASPQLFYRCQDEQQIAAIKKKYSIPEQSTFFLGVGNLAPHKNIAHTIHCFAKLIAQEAINDHYLVIVGSKMWQYESIFSEVEANPMLKNRIIFTGRVDDEDLSALYSEALAFIFMSLYEGFGLPPLEAMQCGVPVITSNTSSLPEVVGDAGIMLDPKDEDGLCQAMLNLYNNPVLRAEMSRKSLQQAAKFSWDKTVQQTIQGYKTALQR